MSGRCLHRLYGNRKGSQKHMKMSVTVLIGGYFWQTKKVLKGRVCRVISIEVSRQALVHRYRLVVNLFSWCLVVPRSFDLRTTGWALSQFQVLLGGWQVVQVPPVLGLKKWMRDQRTPPRIQSQKSKERSSCVCCVDRFHLGALEKAKTNHVIQSFRSSRFPGPGRWLGPPPSPPLSSAEESVIQGQTARNLVLTKFGRLPTKYDQNDPQARTPISPKHPTGTSQWLGPPGMAVLGAICLAMGLASITVIARCCVLSCAEIRSAWEK